MLTPGGDDTQSILSAVAALPQEGGVVELGEGTFVLDRHVTVDRPGVTLRGQGPDATRVLTGSDSSLLEAKHADGLRIHGITFEQTLDTKFQRCVRVASTDDVHIHDCRFEHNGGDRWGSTWPGVAFRRVSHGVVEDCAFVRMQCKLSGNGGGYSLVCRRCTFYRPHNFAVSAVTRHKGDKLSAVVIEDVGITEAQGQGGVYLGSDDGDGSESGMTCSDLRVARVTLSGSTGKLGGGWRGVQLRTPTGGATLLVVEDVHVEVASQSNSRGIYIAPRGNPRGHASRVTVRRCSVKGVSNGAYVFRNADVDIDEVTG